VEKFDSLSDHIISLISHSNRPNRGIPALMQLVFEKATMQHHFISMYVNLCSKLHRLLTEIDRAAEFESQANFKRILLNQCQSSFEQYLEPPDGFDGLEGEDLYEAQVKYKTKMLGNIKLVGALIRHGMLAPKIAIAVAAELVRDDPIVLEERLETLAVFLETVGPCLDDASWSHFAELDRIFKEVQRIISSGIVGARIRFLLRDVLDLRRGRWLVQKVKDLGMDAPMKLSEVHEKARQDQTTPPSSRSDRRDQGGDSVTGQRRLATSGSASGSRLSTLADLDNNHSSFFVGASPSASSSKATPTGSSSGRRKRNGGSSSDHHTPDRSPAASPAMGPKDPPGIGRSSENRRRSKTDGSLYRPKAQENHRPPEELARAFRREAAQVLRQLAAGSLDLPSATQRLKGYGPLPPNHALDEAVDFIARVVDEPRQRRKRSFELLAALVKGGILSPPRILRQAIETFAKDAFADPGSVDPPDLGDIILWEMLPVVDIRPGDLQLPNCLSELVA